MVVRWFVLVVALVLAACSSGAPYVWASELPPAELRAPAAIEAGDRLQVVVFGQDALSGEFDVRPSGDVVLPGGGGTFVAAGKTAEQLAADVQHRLRGLIAEPRVTVVVALRRPPSVSVLGEVRTPGRFEISPGEGVLPALARAGGFTPFADPNRIFVVRAGSGHRIRFRYDDLTSARGASAGFVLRSGDVVVVE